MTDHPVPDHGGALAAAERRFGRPAAGWIDLSTGINPWPWPWPRPLPVSDLAPTVWTRLPDDRDLDRLNAAAAACYGADSGGLVAAAPGSQALIQVLPRLIRPGTVAVLGPTYGEHALCWAQAGHRVRVIQSPSRDTLPPALETFATVVVVNPNNPDGGRRDPDALRWLAGRLQRAGGLLVVDEAFADPDPSLSVAGAVGLGGLCVLRSFGKFFGLAGVRLGFALAAPALALRLRQALGPWAVGGPALALGAAALADAGWIAAMRQALPAAARRLDRILAEAGLTGTGGTALFRLAAHEQAAAVYHACGRAGILVRAFADHRDWLRFGLPADEIAESRLAAALAAGLAAAPAMVRG